MLKPVFIALEGIDGAGKTLQTTMLHDRVRNTYGDDEVVALREPGGTVLGEKVREILKGSVARNALSELMLFQAARAELVDEVIVPALLTGKSVIVDRFAPSTLVYQGYVGNENLDMIKAMTRYATGDLEPDLVIELWAPPATAYARCRQDAFIDGLAQRLDRSPKQLMYDIADGYRQVRIQEIERRGIRHWAIVDATQSEEQVAEAVWKHFCRVARG